MPFFDPGRFVKTEGEDNLHHITCFERTALANFWRDDKKSIYFAVYLEGVALLFFIEF